MANRCSSQSLSAMVAWIQSRGFEVISTTGGSHNRGSLHYVGCAADVRTKTKTKAQVDKLITDGRAAGYKVRDERFWPIGQLVWGGAHVHFEIKPNAAGTTDPLNVPSRANQKQNTFSKIFDPRHRKIIVLLIAGVLLFIALVSYDE